MIFPTMWYVRPAKPQISLRANTRSLIRAFASRLNILLMLSYLPNIINFGVSKLKGCTGPSEYTLVKMPHCWKSHVMAQLCNKIIAILQDSMIASQREVTVTD